MTELNAEYDSTYVTSPGVNTLQITVTPGSVNPNTVQTELRFQSGEIQANNLEIEEGELCMLMRNTLKDIDFEIDDDGNLIVHAEDSNNYSLDDEGNLIYTWR